jgi:hypothetical protein
MLYYYYVDIRDCTACSTRNANPVPTHEPLEAQYCEINGNTEFLQSYPVVGTDALLETGAAVISTTLSHDERLSQTAISRITQFFLPAFKLPYSVLSCEGTCR